MAEEGGILGHLNHVLVKQLASIHADGDHLSRRLHDLRSAASAASATVTASAALCGARPSPSRSCDENNDNNSSSVLRSSKRHHRDSLQEDVVRLCSLTKLLAEENARLHSLNSSLEAEIRVAIQQVERLQQENALLRADGQSKGVQCMGSSVVPGMLHIEKQVDLLHGERREFVELELQRLATDFVQRVIKMEDEVLQNRTREVKQEIQPQNEEEEQQQFRCSDVLNYALPAAAFSGALAAIVVSIRVSATSASNRQIP